MTNRVPLTLNTGASTIEELPSGDNLDLTGSDISNVGNINAGNSVSATYFVGDGSMLTGISASPGGSDTNIQFNNSGAFGGISTVTWDGSKLSLGDVSNVNIGGGTSGQVLSTDGAGNLSFTTVSGSGISNGTSNVNIATSAGNITVGVDGTANTVVFASDSTTINTPIRTANTVIMGNNAGNTSVANTRGDVAIGYRAGGGSISGNPTVAIGFQSGNVAQSQGSVAIGFESGQSQGDAAIAMGYQTGQSQGPYSVAIGLFAGQATQGSSAIAIGNFPAASGQGSSAIAIGTNAGQTSQGNDAIAIGRLAGQTNQPTQSIVLNASGSAVNPSTSGTFHVKPIRTVSDTTGLYQLYYDSTTGEIVYYVP